MPKTAGVAQFPPEEHTDVHLQVCTRERSVRFRKMQGTERMVRTPRFSKPRENCRVQELR
jgi:hypothetical protein